MHDKELAAGGPGYSIGVHGHLAMRRGRPIGHAVLDKLAFNGVAGAAGAGAFRTAALDHKSGDHPVKGQTVIKPLFCQGNKIADRIGGGFRVQFSLHHAAVFHCDRNNRMRHIFLFLS